MEPLNLRRVQYYLAVARHGSVSSAARELHVAQPALSRQLKVFEKEIGVSLFTQRGNRLLLSPGGSALLPLLRHLHVHASEVKLAAGDIAAGTVGRLRLAAAPATTRAILAPFIATLGPDDPLITTQAVGHLEIYESLYRDADAVISTVPPLAQLSRQQIVEAPLRAYCMAGHPLAGRRRIPVVELVEHRLALSPSTASSRVELDAALARLGAGYRDVIECSDGLTLHALAITGRAVAVTTEPPGSDLPGSEGLTGPLVLDDERRPLVVRLHAAWLPDHHASGTILAIAARIRDHARRVFRPDDIG